jgi:transposase-like protein
VLKVPGKTSWQTLRYISDGVNAAERYANMGATCPSCGSTNTHVVQVKDGGVVVRTYFECNSCGFVW